MIECLECLRLKPFTCAMHKVSVGLYAVATITFSSPPCSKVFVGSVQGITTQAKLWAGDRAFSIVVWKTKDDYAACKPSYFARVYLSKQEQKARCPSCTSKASAANQLCEEHHEQWLRENED